MGVPKCGLTIIPNGFPQGSFTIATLISPPTSCGDSSVLARIAAIADSDFYIFLLPIGADRVTFLTCMFIGE
jgi:hypothetical protein